jgi:glycerol-3-phosphate cytidylyltransferase-like family protein
MLLYATYYYCIQNNYRFEVKLNKKINNGVILNFNNKNSFFDYSDDVLFIEKPTNFDFYFKRSLLEKDFFDNILPLNFQVNYSYNSLSFIKCLDRKILTDQKSRVEVIRALDYFNKITNLSHRAMDISTIKRNDNDYQGRVIFQTRLWNPDNNPSLEEKERRNKQNAFRINTCRLIKKYYKNSLVGIYPDSYSSKIASDLLLDKKSITKSIYFRNLFCSDIAIADDGLKDTPGWKIGEYAFFGKAIISTPISTVVESFDENVNFLKLSDRNSYHEIPDKIEWLIEQKRYSEIGSNNFDWANKNLHPKSYIQRIITIMELNK